MRSIKIICAVVCLASVLTTTHELTAVSIKKRDKNGDETIDKAKDTLDNAKKKGKDTAEKAADKLDDLFHPKKK